MIIHVIGSLRQFEEDARYLQTILDTIRLQKETIARNWVNSVLDRRQGVRLQDETDLDWAEIVEDNINASKDSDALIIEGSRFNYSQGFQTALALEHNKPVLNLYRKELPEYKEWPDKMFVSGVSHPKFINKTYTDIYDLTQTVTKFLNDIKPKTHEMNLRLNLDADAFEKVEKLASESDRSKSGIIKQIIEEALNNSK
jgi:hypothetical protein